MAADFQLPFSAFPSYPAALSAPPHLRTLVPAIAPRQESSSTHTVPTLARPQPNTRAIDAPMSQASGFGNGRRVPSGERGAGSSTSSSGATGRASGETPPSSPDLVLPKAEEEVAKVPKAPVKVPAKRGRKKLPLPEELDAMEDLLDGGEGTKKRGKRAEPSAPEKRKLQNRAAQRAFRERKEKHVKDLEDRVVEQDNQLQAFRDMIERLHGENQALRRGEDVPPTQFELPPPMAKLEAPVMRHESPALTPDAPSAVKQSPTDPAFSFRDLDLSAFAPPEPEPSGFYGSIDPSIQPIPALQPPPQDTSPYKPEPQLEPNFDLNNFEFDFDAPFDYTSTIPLPPLFQDLFSQSYAMDTSEVSVPNTPGPFGEAEPDEEACPGDGDDHLPLPNGRIPCDKPQCDFSLISCALPIPWRPPAIGKELAPKDVWVCTQAWAKLCSHPLFGDCDVDELCHELRDKTLCSDDGRVVITKKDVCSVFRSIPARARARREMDATA